MLRFLVGLFLGLVLTAIAQDLQVDSMIPLMLAAGRDASKIAHLLYVNAEGAVRCER